VTWVRSKDGRARGSPTIEAKKFWRGHSGLARSAQIDAPGQLSQRAAGMTANPDQVAIDLTRTVIACDKREAFAQGNASREAIQTAWVALDCFAYAHDDG
jgi:hypothetical protein